VSVYLENAVTNDIIDLNNIMFPDGGMIGGKIKIAPKNSE